MPEKVSTYIHQYNENWLHSTIGFITSFDKLSGKVDSIFKERDMKLSPPRKMGKQKNRKGCLKLT